MTSFPWQPHIIWRTTNSLRHLLLHSSNLLTAAAHMEMKLGTHSYYIISMTTTAGSSRQETVAIYACWKPTYQYWESTKTRRPWKRHNKANSQTQLERQKLLCCFFPKSAGRGCLHSREDDRASETLPAQRMPAPWIVFGLCFILGNGFRP